MEHKSANEWYVSKFKTFEDKLNGQSKSFLHDIRKNALKNLAELSFPSNKNEEWKYTNVAPILKHNFTPAMISTLPKFQKEEIKKFVFKDFDYHLMVFVNGLFAEELSNVNSLPKGVVVDGLNRITKNNPDSISKYINNLSKIDNAFNALNTAYSYDGLVVIVPDGVILEKPIQVLYLNSSENDLVLSLPRNIIIAGKNSQVSVIVNYRGYGDKTYFSNIITEVYVEENAIVHLYKIQNESDESFHIEKVQAILGKINTTVESNVMTDQKMLQSASRTRIAVMLFGIFTIFAGRQNRAFVHQ